jgi:cytochrome b
MSTNDPNHLPPRKLWDLPVRIIHWSFVLLLPLLWLSYEADRMGLHKLLGYAMLALLAFRIFWGFAGSSTARFRNFIRGPRAMIAYLRTERGREGDPIVGHNPIGGWSVIILLGLLTLEVGLGLIAIDEEGIVGGPLVDHVSFAAAETARQWHEQLFDILLGFIGLHVAAILFYLLIRSDNLIGPMISGRKRLPNAAESPSFAPAWRAVAGLIAAGGLAWWISQGAPI